jgi:lysozyme family protein
MSYLGRYEGTVVHWNKTESSYTSPYGVYKKLFPKASVIKYIDKRAEELGINLRRRNTRELARFNRLLTAKDKQIIRDLAYEFMMSHFVDKRVEPYLSPKETLTFFSLSVNGGASRGRKALQSAIGVKVDGKIGKRTLSKLKEYKGDLNRGMLSYMKNFYLSLIRRNPSKYAIYKNGWMNRLKGLA